MNYFLYIDECGDPYLPVVDPKFPVFTLCGFIMSEVQQEKVAAEIQEMKQRFWGEKKVIIHSRDIRKHQKGFEILFADEVKREFYRTVNNVLSQPDYAIVACSVKKNPYIRLYGRLADLYSTSLSFILERTVFYLDEMDDKDTRLHVIIEKRGRKEDNQLLAFYNQLLAHGTYWVSAERLRRYAESFTMLPKSDDVTGLQMADLVAYPLTRHVIDPEMANLAYDVISNQIFRHKILPPDADSSAI